MSRNVATLADTPKGRQGRPSKSLILDQTAAITAAAKTLPVLELRPGLKDVRRPAWPYGSLESAEPASEIKIVV